MIQCLSTGTRINKPRRVHTMEWYHTGRMSLCINQERFHKHVVELKKASTCLLEQPDTSYRRLRDPELDLLPRSTYTCCTHVITGTGMLNSKFTVITPGEKQTERNQRQMRMSPRLICKISTLKSKDIVSWAGIRSQSPALVRQRQKTREFEVSLGYVGNPSPTT